MTRWIGIGLAMAAVAWAAGAPAAQAKGEMTGARLCGHDGCVEVSSTDLRGLNAVIRHIEQQRIPAGLSVPHASGYFVIRARPAWTLEGGHAFVIPAAGMLEMNGVWAPLPHVLAARIARLTAGLAPDTPAALRVVMGGRTAGGPAVASALLGALPRVAAPARVWESALMRVVIRSQPPSPWTDQGIAVPMTYAPRYGLVEVGTGIHWFRVPAAVNAHLRAALGLAPLRAPAGPGSSSRGTTLAVIGATLAVAGLAFIALRRRRGRPATA